MIMSLEISFWKITKTPMQKKFPLRGEQKTMINIFDLLSVTNQTQEVTTQKLKIYALSSLRETIHRTLTFISQICKRRTSRY